MAARLLRLARACPPTDAGPTDAELLARYADGRDEAALAALPERYRTPLVLCYLQGLTHAEAARRAGCPVGALRGRLERGKARLRQRLVRHGLPVAVPALLLGRPTPVPAALSETTLRVARSWAAGGPVPESLGRLLAPAVRLKAALAAAAG